VPQVYRLIAAESLEETIYRLFAEPFILLTHHYLPQVYRLIAAESLEETIYQRQIYKQQTANIALNASHEKRYFKGVQV
jgi:SNF2 family DNA or RNA helicase